MRISDWSSDVCSSDLTISRATSPCSRRCWRNCAPRSCETRGCGSKKCRHDRFCKPALPPLRGGDAGQSRRAHLRRPATRYNERGVADAARSEEHTSELQSLMRISYAVFCLKKNTTHPADRSNETNITHRTTSSNTT